MKTFTILSSIIFILGLSGTAHGQAPSPIRDTLAPPRQATPAQAMGGGKSPGKAFLISAVFPGAGQLYAGRKSGLVYSLLEAGGWTTYVLLRNRGDSRTRRTLTFADAHWDIARCLPECTDGSGPETLEPTGSQQYYEQIGKWDQFRSGWDDYNSAGSGLSPNRAVYIAMRRSMNDPYTQANWIAGMLLFNHVISAVHAAIMVRNDNLDGASVQESRLRFRIESFDIYDPAPSATLSFAF